MNEHAESLNALRAELETVSKQRAHETWWHKELNAFRAAVQLAVSDAALRSHGAIGAVRQIRTLLALLDRDPGRIVSHVPKWASANLPVDAEGNTRPGWVCVHELENGNGRCGGNVFDLADAVGDHSCVVTECGARPPFGSRHCIRESGHNDDHSTGVADTSWRFDFSAYRPAVVQETACARRDNLTHTLDGIARDSGQEDK